MGASKRLPAFFFRTPAGAEPVRDWLLTLASHDRRAIGFDVATVEFGWPVGMPTCRSLGEGLWEVRSRISDGRIARIVFVIHRERMVLLHGFVKKTQKIPRHDLELATRRKKDLDDEL